MSDLVDQLMEQAVTDVLASGPPALGATVATRDRDLTVTLVSVADGIGTLEDVGGDTQTAPMSEVFDVNAVLRRTLELAAITRTFSTN